MAITLDEVAQAYFADAEFQKTRQRLLITRNESIRSLQAVTLRFIRRETNLQSFRAQLERTLRAGEDWGATGFGFMMELNKLGKYHDEHLAIADNELRNTLTDLNAGNVGSRIEQFYNFLLKERERLRRGGKSSGMIVAASRSAFIISLFAFWLDPQGEPIIYYDSMRKGLFLLIKANLLPIPPNLPMGPNAVEVRSEADHTACVELVDYLARRAPQLKTSAYWAEYFCLWVTQHFQTLTEPSSTLIKEADEADLLLAKAPSKNVVIQDEAHSYTLSLPQASIATINAGTASLIPHEPLRPTPEPLLTQLIREVQRQLLVDEQIIRRIYHALLAGHVILTGPPGTGKTDLARIIPEILWRSEAKTEEAESQLEDSSVEAVTKKAYTTRLVIAADEWSVRTLISGIAPQSKNGSVSYNMQYGYLTTTILKNWSFDPNKPEEWNTLRRTMVTAPSGIERGIQQEFRGIWLVIDEFNRDPIDLALGDALTALGGNDVLRVSIEGGSAELPIPLDFRVIGTLNSFDRNYLNQISEALKRRFSFIEILPPTRIQRAAEQAIVLYKALKKISHLSDSISLDDEGTIYWQGGVAIGADASGMYSILWEEEHHAFREAFEAAWRIFEVIRIYRQLGTAQAISVLQDMLIAGILQDFTTRNGWIEQALDAALCDTLADQLQVLLPDEIEVLLLYLTTDHAAFVEAYNQLLTRLTPNRLYGQLLSLSSVSTADGQAFLSDTEIEQIAVQNQPEIPAAKLADLFHLAQPGGRLPQFTHRLRTFKAERGV